jgi:hypothetical protein
MPKVKQIIMRKVGTSTHLAIPPEFLKANHLEAGDAAFWMQDPNGDIRLRFMKTSVIAELARNGALPPKVSASVMEATL